MTEQEEKIFDLLLEINNPDLAKRLKAEIIKYKAQFKDCQCVHELNERLPSELINKQCDDCGGSIEKAKRVWNK